MSARNIFDSIYLTWFSQPKCDRALFRVVKKQRISKLVEIGLRDVERSQRLIRMAQIASNGEYEVRYTGIDLFEAREADEAVMTLKGTHQSLAQMGASVRLIPGEPTGALSRYANHLGGTQLLIISHRMSRSLEAAWYYVPRMLTEKASLFIQSSPDSANQNSYRPVLPDEIQRLADTAGRGERKAA
ncbi:MAG: hypothetical protein P8N76_12025 [Pirellulaceae bacterium]|nr:hypothetical protein [Pirellulaceae bacterium]